MDVFFSPAANATVQTATNIAAGLGYEFVDAEHILLAVINESLIHANDEDRVIKILEHLKVNLLNLRADIQASFSKLEPGEVSRQIPFTRRAEMIVKLSYLESREYNSSNIAAVHFFLSYFRTESVFSSEILNGKYGLTYERIKSTMLEIG